MRRANTGHGASENSSAGARKYFLFGDRIARERRAQCRKLEIHNVSPNTPSPAAAVQMRYWKIIEVPMVQIIQFNSSVSESREHQAGEVAYCAAHSRASQQRCGLTVARGGPQ